MQDKTTFDVIPGTSGDHDVSPRALLALYYKGGSSFSDFSSGQSIVVGRVEPANVVVPDPTVSRQHARFYFDQGGAVRVEDLGSRNGVFVRGARVSEARLQSGQEVVLGSVTAVIHITRAAALTRSGLDDYDHFVPDLAAEVARARQFKRPLALLMVQGSSPATHFGQHILSAMRSIDRVVVYGPRSVLVCMPESGAEEARRAAKALVGLEGIGASLRCGIAIWPFDGASHEELIGRAREALEQTGGEHAIASASAAAPAAHEDIVIASAEMRRLYEIVQKAAARDISVLILGETGTGKELVANALHRASPRCSQRMRVVNCAAIPDTLIESEFFGYEKGAFTGATATAKGIFEQAHLGTVFLDEVGELSPSAQASLLRVLDTRRLTRLGGSKEIEVDVRVVAATHQDLPAMIRDGRFREDLYYRLSLLSVHVPPLRDRKEEIEPLAMSFLQKTRQRGQTDLVEISPQAREALFNYDWPGNARELRNVIERATVYASSAVLQLEDLPEALRQESSPEHRENIHDTDTTAPDLSQSYRSRTRTHEAEMILDALARSNGSHQRAAALLQMSTRTFSRKFTELGLRKP
jgi:DNA-binding NtrC family response regulator